MFEAAGEMALVGETAGAGDTDEVHLMGGEQAFGVKYLAFQEQSFGGDAKQFGKAAMKMEGA